MNCAEWGTAELRTCKVPQITWVFWIIKCCCTTVGESLSDYFNVDLGFGLGGAAALFFPLLVLNLVVQFGLRFYNPSTYWCAVVLMSICGTIWTDGLHDNLGAQNSILVACFAPILLLVFYLWYRTEGTLDVHSINTFRREAWYWLVVIWTFALGTAIGDGTAAWSGLGFGPILGLWVAVLAVILFVWYIKAVDNVLGFWMAYVMTRPLGASAGDLLAESLGIGYTALVFLIIIIVCVAGLEYTKFDQIKIEKTGVEPVDTDTKAGAVQLTDQPSTEDDEIAILEAEIDP
jgi:uncharacterized membrane-anchored protein